MKRFFSYFFEAFGSLFSLFPARRMHKNTLDDFLSKSDTDRIRGDFERVGQYIESAMVKLGNENPELKEIVKDLKSKH